MIGPGTHAAFVFSAYAITALILGWAIAGSWLALRASRAKLSRLEKAFPEGGKQP
jgi:heme exporter protein CcmD